MTVRVRLLGRPRVEPAEAVEASRPRGRDEAGQPRPRPRGQKSWAVLARVALAERPLGRPNLAGELFPNADDPLAALRWTLADLRRGLGRPEILRGDRLALARGELWLDVWSIQDGTLADADLGQVLLDGVDLEDCPEFDLWLMMARARLTATSLDALRERALTALTAGMARRATELAQAAVRLDPLDEAAQELFLRCLVADARPALAAAQLAACEVAFNRAGIPVSPALRAAAHDRAGRAPIGVRAGVIAASLLDAGTAALDAGAVDGGIETLRRAAADAQRSGDAALQAQVLRALGGALVHAVRGFDGEGAVVLHQALRLARSAGRAAIAADALRELAFVDVQAGRHSSATRAIQAAKRETAHLATADPETVALHAGILAIEGMNEADQGRHVAAVRLLTESADRADSANRPRQASWSRGVMARSLLLSGSVDAARATAQASLIGAQSQRWNAFVPWPQAIHAECLAIDAQWIAARSDAEHAFALACELGDPCWEGMGGRALSLIEAHDGDDDAAWDLIVDARRRCDRVPDRYSWISCHVGLTQLQLAERRDASIVPALAQRLQRDATRADLPEFTAWALVHRSRTDGPGALTLAYDAARGVDNPALHAQIAALGGPTTQLNPRTRSDDDPN